MAHFSSGDARIPRRLGFFHRFGVAGLVSPVRVLLSDRNDNALSAQRPSEGGLGLSVEWRPLGALASIVEAWRALAGRAVDPNVFYEPAFALAAAPVFGRDVGAVLVWSGEAPRRLTGLFPARVATWRRGFLRPVTLGWTHPFAPLGIPLVDRDQVGRTIAAWLDFIASHKALPKRVLLPFVPAESRFATALAAALAERDLPSALFAAHRRALLAPAGDRAGYLSRALSGKKRKELSRQRRRLAEAGEVATVIVSDPEKVAAALEVFLAIEQSGWKGRGGTAAAQDPAIRRFMQQAVRGLAETGQAQVAELCAGVRPLAAGIFLRSGATGWFWKIAYDEEAARASPGVQLALDLTQAALGDASLAAVDSCATADHPMIDHLWRERLLVADLLFAADISSGSDVRFALARGAETARRRAFDAARWLRKRLRGPRGR